MQRIDEEEDGLVFFDGGTFSRGPHWLVDPSTEDLEEGGLEREDAGQVASITCVVTVKCIRCQFLTAYNDSIRFAGSL